MTRAKAENIHPFPIADATTSLRHVFVRDLVLACRIGVHRHERGMRQRVRINLDLAVSEEAGPRSDNLSEVVCYEGIVASVRGIIESGHVNLVETLAERIAETCFADPRVRRARVRVEKLDVFSDASSVGVEIERIRCAV
jgi:dihydroneopterin aldolase